MANKTGEIIVTVTVTPHISLWDAIKMRIAGNAKVFWVELAKKITEDKYVEK